MDSINQNESIVGFAVNLMKRLRLKTQAHHSSDVEQIWQAMTDAGYDVCRCECRKAWEEYSDSMEAGWMFVPEDDPEKIISCIIRYFEDTAGYDSENDS